MNQNKQSKQPNNKRKNEEKMKQTTQRITRTKYQQRSNLYLFLYLIVLIFDSFIFFDRKLTAELTINQTSEFNELTK